MKRLKRLSFYFTIIFLICQVFIGFATPASASSDTDNFYFRSFNANYYLSRDDQGKSHLKVIEELVAVFPDYDQNHGIVRNIPTSSDKIVGFNTVNMIHVPGQHFDKKDLKITHNGIAEAADTIEDHQNYISVYIRNPNQYIHGTQTYTIEYEYQNVITGVDSQGKWTFDPAQEISQELYWNTNGTSWEQSFQTLTARVHITDKQAYGNWKGDSWCYVGKMGSNNQDRCKRIEIEDGMEFSATNLQPKENLTFSIPFDAKTFTIDTPPANYNVVIFGGIIGLALIVITALAIRLWIRARGNRNAYKKSFKPAQYIPMKNMSVAEMANLSLKHLKSIPQTKIRVATLIELAVNHKITLVKGEEAGLGKHEWGIRVDDLKGVPPESVAVLQMLNQGGKISKGMTFTVDKQRYNPTLKSLNDATDKLLDDNLVAKQMLKPADERKTPEGKIFLMATAIAIFAVIFVVVVGNAFLKAAGTTMIGTQLFSPCILPIIAIALFDILLFSRARRYLSFTDKGLEAAVYLDGLQEYIKLAEADRLKILQSVKGADTSPQGIVKLYEKLLPYAIIFGLEQSWMNELNRYYEMKDVDAATWYLGTRMLIWSDFRHFSSGITTSISSGSGSGGGGFSGGGGGGGGGGGC